MSVITPVSVLLHAQQASLTRDQRLGSLTLNPLRDKVPSLPIDDAITSAKVTLTIDGPSTVQLGIEDPTWQIERSGLLDTDSNGRLDAIALSVDTLPFRLSAARRDSAETLTLEFEDLAKALLDQHSKHISASRGKVTRAQFIQRMVKEVKARRLSFWSPSSIVTQTVAVPDLPSVRPKFGDTGFDEGVTFKVKKIEADGGQMREAAKVMGVCDQLNVSPRVRLAILVAAIGESSFRAIPNAKGSDYGGVLQGKYKGTNPQFKISDTEGMAKSFLKGGKGFQAGGAIALARANPGMSAGTIAYKVEGDLANFHGDTKAAEQFYQQHHDEAKKIADLWNGGGTVSSPVEYKQYRFTRGLPGQRETSWEAGQRLAQEVNWRLFAIGGLVVYVSDDDLITFRASVVLDAEDATGKWQLPQGLLELPGYDVNHGKTASTVTLRVLANSWSLYPGSVVALRNMGPASGRWIVETFEFDLLDPTEAAVTLIKPVRARLEPAPEVTTADKPDSAAGSADGGTAPTIHQGAMNPGTHLSKPLLQFLGQVGSKLGKPLVVTTGTHHDKYTDNGSVSDHYTGDAADMGTVANGIATCDQICFHALRLCGITDAQAQKYADNGIGQAGVDLRWKGHRVQIFWKSNDPGIGDHYDHVHIGVAP